MTFIKGCTVAFALSAAAMLSGCGDPKKAAIDDAITTCLYELTEAFPSQASYGIDHDRKPEITSEDAAAKRYEVRVPVHAMGDRFVCFASVDPKGTKANFKK